MASDPIQGMESVVASVSGYSGLERQNLIKLMTYAGALSRLNSFTHLVCWKFEGRKYELAKKFKMIVVKHRWIEDCIEQGKMVPEHPFTLKRRD